MASGVTAIVREATRAAELAEKSGKEPEELVRSTKRVVKLFSDFREYVESMASPVSAEVGAIVEFTNMHEWETINLSRMMTGNEEAQVLRMFVSMSRATHVLEIGMFTGCAALAMAEALPSNGTLVTCDINPALESLVRGLVDKSPHGKKITIKIGPALETMKTLLKDGNTFDFVFIDADKGSYHEYYQFLLDKGLLAPGGTICVDNTLWGGTAYSPTEQRNSPDSRSISAFNDMVASDERVYQVLLPIRDGMTLIRRKTDVDIDVSK